MATWSGEEVAAGMERWLKTRRDEYHPEGWDTRDSQVENDASYKAIDELIDEILDDFAEGFMPWQCMEESREEAPDA